MKVEDVLTDYIIACLKTNATIEHRDSRCTCGDIIYPYETDCKAHSFDALAHNDWDKSIFNGNHMREKGK